MEAQPPSEPGWLPRALARIRRYLISGVLVSVPIGSTIYLVWVVVRFFDRRIEPLIPARLNPETYLPEVLRPVGIPGLGLVVALLALIAIGWAAGRLTGRWLLSQSDRVFGRLPVVRTIYGSMKQISETVLTSQSRAFREVVLFEYPRRGAWAIGFVTGVTRGQVQNMAADEMVNIFLPTTPNPTSGYLLILPRHEIIPLQMTVEEGIKMIISAGMVTPPDRRPSDEQSHVLVKAADGDRPTIGGGSS